MIGNIKGSTLVTAVVAQVIFTFLIMATYSALRIQAKSYGSSVRFMEIEDLRLYIRVATACTSTLYPTSCAIGTGVPLFRKRNPAQSVLEANGATKIGRYQVQAKCLGSGQYEFNYSSDNVNWKPLFELPRTCHG